MTRFTGRLQNPELGLSRVVFDVNDGRLRLSAGAADIGSWPLSRVRAERTSIYRFDLTIDQDRFDFFPDDPSSFADAVGAVVDLTEASGRFGLKARIDRVADAS